MGKQERQRQLFVCSHRSPFSESSGQGAIAGLLSFVGVAGHIAWMSEHSSPDSPSSKRDSNHPDSADNEKSGWLFRLAQYVFLFGARFTRGMTMGVRAMVLDGEGRIFLVRHTYVKGWHMPGGGVSPGETLIEALAKELHEEGNIRLLQPADLLGVYLNRKASGRDHVAVYVVREFVQEKQKHADHEIAESGFFPLAALPDGTTQATHRRIAEALKGLPPTQEW